MATQTTNLGLTKPDAAEGYDINVFNGNADKMDEFAGEVRRMLGGTGGGLGDKVDTLLENVAAVKADTSALMQALATANANIATLLTQTKGVKSVHHRKAYGSSPDGTLKDNIPSGVNSNRIAIIIAPLTPASFVISGNEITFTKYETGSITIYYTIIEFY